MGEELLYEVQKGAAFLTINRESRRNALSHETVRAFLTCLEQADKDGSVRALCITGAGEKAFCSGADLAGMPGHEGGGPLSAAETYAELLKTMDRFPKPLVARVNGPCLAGGLGLMLSCDVIVARNDAFFSTPEVNVGIFPMMVGALLYRCVSRKKAVDMVLTGRKIFASEAEQMGLITRAVEPERLDDEVEEILNGLKAKSPAGIRIGKEAFRMMSDMSFEAAVDYLCKALERVVATEDAAEGMAAFLEKRKPDFKGR